ncbi:hypothetical protein LOTGIDRAFT_171822 [Lottia gigantea]|uniref:Uncharacterized protein n=1 Tax=Lottia gigantea TaxID=225164 RepID=V4B533_LOTGI|nr:hypothetical protein LOTGIDRAFT_171822 [Lottia gigantea]ESP02621.1 hypothetical protein LOTGIDRAFT_171822 [Lottia gigantea]
MWITNCLLLLACVFYTVHGSYIETINVELLVENGGEISTRLQREDMATYVDYSTKAVIFITKRPDSQNFYNLEGHLQIGMRLVHIEPNSGGSQHVIVRQETLRYKPQDYTGHRQKRSLRVFTIEVGFVADYQNYLSFLNRSNEDVEIAETEMKHYFAFIAEKLKVRYHHINEVDGTIAVDVVTAGLTIVEERELSTFSENYVVSRTVEARTMLNASQYWFLNPPNGTILPPADHYMFFTGYNLVHAENLGNAGLAYKAATCVESQYSNLVKSTSVVEDHRDGETGVTASHELGHALNMSHDTAVGCKDSDSYIMAGTAVLILDSSKAQRPWQFSTCSVRDMKTFILGDGGKCFGDNRYGTGVVTSSERPGQYFNLDEQCAMKYNESFTFCSFPYTSDKDQLCYILYCFDGKSNCLSARVMEYTTCDVNKWCHRGLCIKANNTAPEFVNLPTGSVNLAPTAQGVILKVQTFDPDEGDVMVFHTTWDPPSIADIVAFDATKKEASVQPGKSLASVKNFSLIMSVDDGLLITLPVNVDFVVTQSANSPPRFTQTIYIGQVSEGKAGTLVYDLSKKVVDTDSTAFTFSLVRPQFPSTYFNINDTGIITYARDYDNPSVSTNHGTVTGTLTINLVNTNEKPFFREDTYNIQVMNGPKGSIVVQGLNNLIIDPDVGDVLMYRIETSDYSFYFAINASNGQITFAEDYGYDKTIYPRKVNLTVSVTDEEGLRDSAVLLITITTQNQKPVISNLPEAASVEENSADGLEVFIVSFTDVNLEDNHTFSLLSTPAEMANAFTIDNNGIIRVNTGAILDFETSPVKIYVQVTVTDSQGAASDPRTLTVSLTDVNEAPRFNQTAYNFIVTEGKGGQVLIDSLVPFVTDPDAGDTLHFSIIQSVYSLHFMVDKNNGSITFNGDYDADPKRLPNTVDMYVAVRDDGLQSHRADFIFNITNVNQAPRFSNLPRTIELQTPIADGIDIFTVKFVDKDSTDVLTLEADLQQTAPFFTFNATAKTLILTNSAGITTNITFVIKFTISDGQLSATANLTIRYTILPEVTTITTTAFPPTTTIRQLFILDLPAAVIISENFGNESFYTVTTNALDVSKLNFTFEQFPAGLPELFMISNGGAVFVKNVAALDFETLPPTVYLLVTAYEGTLKSSSEYLNISITNVNEPVSFNQTTYRFAIKKAQAGQTLIESLLPFLMDADNTDTYTFVLRSGNDSKHFIIDESTGAISLLNTFDIDTVSTVVSLTVAVKDATSSFVPAEVRFTFNKPPRFSNLPTTIDVPEVTSVGVEVFTVSVTDPNVGDVVAVIEDRHTSVGFTTFDVIFDATKGNTVSVQGTAVQDASRMKATIYFTATDGIYTIESSLIINIVKTVPTSTPTSEKPVTTASELPVTTKDSGVPNGQTPQGTGSTLSTTPSTTSPAEPLFNRPWVIVVLSVVGILIPTLIILVVCIMYRRSKQGDNIYFTNSDYLYEKDVEY